MGRTVVLSPRITFRCPPLPGRTVHPCFSSHLFSSELFTPLAYNISVVLSTTLTVSRAALSHG